MAARRKILILLALALVVASLAYPGLQAQGGGRGDFLVPPHLSWQHDPRTSMTIAWATRERENGSEVRYGRTAALELPPRRANTSLLVPGYQGFGHIVELRDLDPNTTYYYSVGSETRGWSDVHSFTTAPGDSQPFTFLAFADMGTTPEAAAAAGTMASLDYAFSIHAGDISYAGGNQARWDQFFQEVSPMASRHPYMAVPGNHENETRERLVSYTSRFAMPPMANPLDPARSGLYYSFNYSMVHFVGLKADGQGGEYPADPGWDPLQTAWLQRDLSLAARDPAHPWIIAYLHFPPFSSGSTHGSWLAGREAWSTLFDRYHVALVITGHDHEYERTYPVWANGTVAVRSPNGTFGDPPAPIYVVTGGGGESHGGFARIQGWSAFHSQAFEFLEVTVMAGALGVRAINSQDGSLVDCFQIVRAGPPIPRGELCRGIPLPPKPLGRLMVWGAAAAGVGVAVATLAVLARLRRRPPGG